MTDKQKETYNTMRATLLIISRYYQTTKQVKKWGKENDLDYEKALEHAYKDIKQTAKSVVKGVRKIK